MLAHEGTVERCNADGDRCINSVLVNVLTKGQGGAILPMEDTKLQELRKIENGPTGSESRGLVKGLAI